MQPMSQISPCSTTAGEAREKCSRGAGDAFGAAQRKGSLRKGSGSIGSYSFQPFCAHAFSISDETYGDNGFGAPTVCRRLLREGFGKPGHLLYPLL
mgnify:CR=1 FL=1